MDKQTGEHGPSRSATSGDSEREKKPLSIGDQVLRGAKSNTKIEDVEEALATTRKRKGEEFPYRDGYGTSGKEEAGLLRYRQMAAKNKTNLTTAVRDYKAAEDAWRADPVQGLCIRRSAWVFRNRSFKLQRNDFMTSMETSVAGNNRDNGRQSRH
jgi:hypothetical protein